MAQAVFKGGKRSGGGGQGKGGGGFVGKKERAGRQVGRSGMFEHGREKALLEFKVKNSPSSPPNTWSGGQIRTNGK